MLLCFTLRTMTAERSLEGQSALGRQLTFRKVRKIRKYTQQIDGELKERGRCHPTCLPCVSSPHSPTHFDSVSSHKSIAQTFSGQKNCGIWWWIASCPFLMHLQANTGPHMPIHAQASIVSATLFTVVKIKRNDKKFKGGEIHFGSQFRRHSPSQWEDLTVGPSPIHDSRKLRHSISHISERYIDEGTV